MGVDRHPGPAHNTFVVTIGWAPEVRGILWMKAVAALCCAGAAFYFATLPALEAARGHVVLVHFFATWCESCREELPALNRLAVRAGGNVTVLGIAVADADQRMQGFFATTPVDFPILLDRDRAAAKACQVATLPTTFVLDADLHPSFVVGTDCAWDGVDPKELTSTSDRRGCAACKQKSQQLITFLGG
jgi:thiol-disulfide isomerase/thioredoxin